MPLPEAFSPPEMAGKFGGYAAARSPLCLKRFHVLEMAMDLARDDG